jgi:biopolymer transport protein ExbB
MNKLCYLLVLVYCLCSVPAMAQDMRKDHLSLAKKQQMMQEKASKELDQARAAAKEKDLEIKKNKKALIAAIEDLKTKNKNLKIDNRQIEKTIQGLEKTQIKLKADLSESQILNQELSGYIQTNSRDLEKLLIKSLQTGLEDHNKILDRHKFLDPMGRQGKIVPEKLNPKKIWAMEDITQMADILFQEIQASGEVKITKSLIIDRQGREQEAQVLTLGNFTGIYMLENKSNSNSNSNSEDEIGFLLYSEKSRQFFALSKLPSQGMAARISDYFAGDSDDVVLDISKGEALRQLTHELSLVEQVPKGGPIIWPILVILVLSLVILGERLLFFSFKQIRVEPFMAKVRDLVAREDWDACKQLFSSKNKRLIPKILLTALPFRDLSRQDMENVLQEAILGEIPRIERFLSTLGMLAAIAPLLGLLGTVTGMINTFHVITYFGAGDARMMSGGISEALVTTMLGLSVAIPIMLFHTLLSRRADTQISQMEEKAVAFVNMVFKARNECRQ